jgi:hypothetical protein
MLDDKKTFIVKAALETIDEIQYEDRELLRARLKGAISSLNKINSKGMVNSLLANFRSQISAVSKEEFEFALNFNRDLINGSLRLKS